MNIKTKDQSKLSTLKIVINPHSLKHHLSNDDGFPSAYLRTIGAIASSNKLVSPAGYAIVNQIANNGDESAVASVILLNALEQPLSLNDALIQLKKSSENIDHDVRKVSFDAARQLLQMQGKNARNLAKKLAKALAYELTTLELSTFSDDSDKNYFQKFWCQLSTTIAKNKELRSLADMCLSLTGDEHIAQSVVDYEGGLINLEELRAAIFSTCVEINKQIEALKDQLVVSEFATKSTTSYLQTAKLLKNQITQRMAIIEARLLFEKETFEEDIEYIIHDAGNAFEIDITERLKTDQWKNTKTWESIGRTSFSKELDRRISRAVTRRENLLQLIKEELRVFQEEIGITRISILRQQHHTRFNNSMPNLRTGTRVFNTIDSAAFVTLGGSGVAIASAGAATYFLGTAVVLPVIAPVLPFVAVPMVLAAVFKWFSDSDAKKDGEISHKREAFENKLREQLFQAKISFNSQLEVIARDFQNSAIQMIQPIMLEAEAADILAELQVKMIKKLIDQSSIKVTTIMESIPLK